MDKRFVSSVVVMCIPLLIRLAVCYFTLIPRHYIRLMHTLLIFLFYISTQTYNIFLHFLLVLSCTLILLIFYSFFASFYIVSNFLTHQTFAWLYTFYLTLMNNIFSYFESFRCNSMFRWECFVYCETYP